MIALNSVTVPVKKTGISIWQSTKIAKALLHWLVSQVCLLGTLVKNVSVITLYLSKR